MGSDHDRQKLRWKEAVGELGWGLSRRMGVWGEVIQRLVGATGWLEFV